MCACTNSTKSKEKNKKKNFGPHGSVRIVIATSALGMGVDFRCLYRVISYGPPNDIEVIFQKRVRVFHRGFQTREN